MILSHVMPTNGSDEQLFTVQQVAENIYRVKPIFLNPFFPTFIIYL